MDGVVDEAKKLVLRLKELADNMTEEQKTEMANYCEELEKK